MSKSRVKIIVALVAAASLVAGIVVLVPQLNGVQSFVNEKILHNYKTVVYRNDKVGFTLDLPDYYVTEEFNYEEYHGVLFLRATTDPQVKVWSPGSNYAPVFSLSSKPHEYYDWLKTNCKDVSVENASPSCQATYGVDGLRMVGENNKFVLTYLRMDKSPDFKDNLPHEYREEAEKIMESFKTFDIQ